MSLFGVPRVKICCIQNVSEARLAIRYGAAAIGLISEMPSGPGPISEEKISVIAGNIPPAVASFLLTSKQDTISIIAQQKKCRVNTIQICDRLLTGSYADFRSELPGISIVQVIHITGEDAIDRAVRLAPQVDGILLDSGSPDAEVKQLGGTGRVHNWRISRRIREAVDVPVFLAGGLHAGNVAAAMEEVQPYAVDVCNGVRTNGLLDEKKLSDFFDRIVSR